MAGIGVIGIVFALCVSFLHKTTPKLAATNTPQPSKKPKKTKAPDFAGAIS